MILKGYEIPRKEVCISEYEVSEIMKLRLNMIELDCNYGKKSCAKHVGE